MNARFDFIIHWLFAISFAVLVFSGIAMIGARYGWLLQYNIPLADYVHRLAAVIFTVLAAIAIGHEVSRTISRDHKMLPWGIFQPSGYGLFTLVTALLFMLSGIIMWRGHHDNHAALAFALFIHEKLTYVALAGVIWHVYQKAHALSWPTAAVAKLPLLQQPWYKTGVWVIAGGFFFSLAAVLISEGSPQPDQTQVMLFMSGMMQAMEQALMGIACMDNGVTPAMRYSAEIFVPLLFFAVVSALLFMPHAKGKQKP